MGYLLGEPELVGALASAQPPWPVNTLALEALVACSQPDAAAWADEQARRTAGWRASLAAALDRLPGLAVAPGGRAPFLLLRADAAPEVRARLRGLGIAVRRGDTFPGLDASWLRIVVVGPSTTTASSTASPAACPPGLTARP